MNPVLRPDSIHCVHFGAVKFDGASWWHRHVRTQTHRNQLRKVQVVLTWRDHVTVQQLAQSFSKVIQHTHRFAAGVPFRSFNATIRRLTKRSTINQ